jgi:hypothetical protein
MQYQNVETGRIREFEKGQPIPKEYVALKDKSGNNNPMSGKHHSEEAKANIGEKNSQRMKGRHWYNNGLEDRMDYQCPEGFEPGRLKKKF